jgi:hypothetical protein
MPLNSHFWNQVSKKAAEKELNKNKPKKPALSLENLYSVIRENNYALFAQDIAPESETPTSPSNAARPIGVVSKEFLNKISKGVRLQDPSISKGHGKEGKDLLSAIVSEKCKVPKAYVKDMVATLSGIIENSSYEHGVDLLKFVWDKYVSGQSLFDALKEGKYNVMDVVIASLPANLQTSGLKEFLQAIYVNNVKFGNTNVGIAEFFYSLFSQAIAGVEEGNSSTKSGDLTVGAINIEVKGTGARYDGSDFIFKSAETITKILPQFKLQQSQSLQKQRFVKDLLNQLQSLVSATPQTKKQLLDFVNYVNAKLGEKSFSHAPSAEPFVTIINNINEYIKECEANNAEPTLANKTNLSLKFTKSLKTTVSVFDVIKKKLQERGGSKEVEKIPKGTNPLNTLDSAFDAIKNSGMAASTDDLMSIICSVNSYDPGVLNKLGYDIKSDLASLIGNDTQSILNLTPSYLRKLIGAMHVVSYMHFLRHTNEDRLLLVDISKGNVINLPAPLSLEQGLKLTQTPGVVVELYMDNPEAGGTVRAKSVKVYLGNY